MGTSNWQNISYSVELIRRLDPVSVLDVGCGFGRWGFLCREFLDVWNSRTYPESWKISIEGIEIFPQNITPIHDYVYDKIHLGDASQLLPVLGTFDLVIFGDVLEHFDKYNAERLLENAIAHANKAVLIHVPLGTDWPQGPRDGNDYETHLSTWNLSDLRRYGGRIKVFRDYIGRRYAVALIFKQEQHILKELHLRATLFKMGLIRDLRLVSHKSTKLLRIR